jgi:hypothetical protein
MLAELHGGWTKPGEAEMITLLPIVLSASLSPAPVANTVSKRDIGRECRAEGGPEQVQQRCAVDEAQARDELQKDWMRFSPTAKAQCNAEAGAEGTSSYSNF